VAGQEADYRAAPRAAAGLADRAMNLAGRPNRMIPVVGELSFFRPVRSLRGLRARWLVQIADHDRGAPPRVAAKAAFRGRAEVRHYPCDHFDPHPGRPCHELAVAHQTAFLRRVPQPRPRSQ
jgi:hypothetical protein